jgi:hypothetical protein
MATNGPTCVVHAMPQFKKSGGPKKLPDVPMDNLPAGGGEGTRTRSSTKDSPSMTAHSSRATTGSKKGSY